MEQKYNLPLTEKFQRLAWKEMRKSANFLHGPDTTSVPKSFYGKWPYSAWPGIHRWFVKRLQAVLKHTLGSHTTFMERKSVDVSDHLIIAINICHMIAKCQCLTAKLSKAETQWQVKFHWEALTKTEVCQDNTALVVNVFRASQQEQDKVHIS